MIEINHYREKLTSNSLKFGAAYFPNLTANFAYFYENSEVQISRNSFETSLSDFEKIDPELYKKYTDLLQNNLVKIPPTSAVIAKYLKTDEERGIWKAPATIALEEVKSLEFYIKNDNEQKLLNFDEIFGKSINCIRKFSGRGILIWGARTLMGNDNEWRYIPVRRLANRIETDIYNGLKPIIFEQNSESTWIKIKAAIENYLNQLWRNGALAGNKPENAYFVSCGLNETMTQTDIDDENLIIKIGIAAIIPAEFIVLRLEFKMMEK